MWLADRPLSLLRLLFGVKAGLGSDPSALAAIRGSCGLCILPSSC